MRLAMTAPSRSTLRRLKPPRALGALLGIVAIVGLCWALTVPPWQSPDELSHYAYVESLATSFRLPGNPHRGLFSIDEADAGGPSDASLGAFYPQAVPPSWSRDVYDDYLHQHSRSEADRADGGGPSSASSNPPLYYLFASVGYLVAGGHGTAFARLYGIRIQGVLLLLATTLGAWLLAGETFGRRRLPQLATAAVAGLLPMSAFMSTNVNPDAAIITEWTFALWLGARIVNRGARVRDVVAMCAVLAAAILTKDTSYALIAPELLGVAIGLARRPAGRRLPAVPALAGSSLVAIIPVTWWLIQSRSLGGTAINSVTTGERPFSIPQFFSYVWQFYLPRLPFMAPFRLVPGLPASYVWIDEGAGNFGWLDVSVPLWMLTVAKVLVALLSICSLWLLSRLRGLHRLGLLAFYLLALIALLVLLHVTEYRQWLGGGGAFLQARYLLPVVGLLGLSVGLVLTRLPRVTRPAAVALVIVGLLAAQAISLATVVHAYYL
jgi:4-amino-4-deoxy-L-arabinose transferase-like glycosyltransferase